METVRVQARKRYLCCHVHLDTTLSLLSRTLRYINPAEVAEWPVGLREPTHLCACVSEERGDGEGAGSQALSVLSDTLRYINLAEVAIGPVGFRGPVHL